jgi:fucose 4-O-acetylase-like acetyltransferase
VAVLAAMVVLLVVPLELLAVRHLLSMPQDRTAQLLISGVLVAAAAVVLMLTMAVAVAVAARGD